MTGGQVSPATPPGRFASTAPFGSFEPNFDIAALAAGAGASFVARETVAKPLLLDRLIERAIRKKGFSLVEALTPCPTAYGRRNKAGDAVDMVRDLKDRSVSVARAAEMTDGERADAIVTGVFVDVDKPEYTEQYARLVERLRAKEAAPC
jgi:2-oxoglutarate ferredoxin oxidoreductase subunit beta